MKAKDTLFACKKNSKTVLIIGLGVSGYEASRWLKTNGYNAVILEGQSEEHFLSNAVNTGYVAELSKLGILIEFGIDFNNIGKFLAGAGLAILSPGISPKSEIVNKISAAGIFFTNELILGLELFEGKIVAVTGSNGKSTTVTLIDHILRYCGVNSIACGNIGQPILGVLSSKIKFDVLVVEVSSYQLELSHRLNPDIGVLLNISDNHLSRHGTIKEYFSVKSTIFSTQDSQDSTAILNYDDPIVSTLSEKVMAKVVSFGMAPDNDAVVSFDTESNNRSVIINNSDNFTLTKTRLLGKHNYYNTATAILVADKFGLEKGDIQKALESYVPLEHRIEMVLDMGGVLYFNDSKSTTVASTLAAVDLMLEEFPERQIALMIGGIIKGGSWLSLFERISGFRERFYPINCFGQDGQILFDEASGFGISVKYTPTMKEGLDYLHNLVDEESLILFSPGGASFDEFRDYEDRGRIFKNIVCSYGKK